MRGTTWKGSVCARPIKLKAQLMWTNDNHGPDTGSGQRAGPSLATPGELLPESQNSYCLKAIDMVEPRIRTRVMDIGMTPQLRLRPCMGGWEGGWAGVCGWAGGRVRGMAGWVAGWVGGRVGGWGEGRHYPHLPGLSIRGKCGKRSTETSVTRSAPSWRRTLPMWVVAYEIGKKRKKS